MTQENQRCYYVDWLRVWAMAVVFIFHCARFFDHVGWHVKNPDPHMGFTLFMYFTHQWTMPLFFLLSGAASWFSLGNRTGKEYTAARFKRLLIPYIFGILVLIPPQKFLEALTQHGFKGNYFDFLVRYFSADTLWIGPSLRFFGHYGYHLWFLGFLAVFSLAALPLFKTLRKEKARQLITKWAAFFTKKGRIFLLFLPLAVVQIVLKPLFPDYLHWADTVYWAIFFLYGYIIFSNHQFEETLMRHRNIALVMGVLCYLTMAGWAYWGNVMPLESQPGYSLLDTVYQLLRSINTWAWIVFILGTGKKYLDKKSKTLNYCNEAVLPFYILHQTVILIVGFYVVQWPIPMIAKFGVIVLISFIGIMIPYELIKRFPPTRFLFGMKFKNK
ncbi:MAG: acyltransferase family protein [bacterium]|nr:acyltransferase family protein [bacterium]